MKTKFTFKMKVLVTFYAILIGLFYALNANAQTYGAPLFTEDFGKVPAGTSIPLNYRGEITGRGTIGGAYTFNPTGQTDDGRYALTPNPTKIHSSAWINMEDHTNDQYGLMLVVNAAFTKGLFYKRAVTGLCYNSQFEFKAFYSNVLHQKLGCTGQIPINIRFEIWSKDPGDSEDNSSIIVGNLAPNGAKLLAAMNTGDVAATNQTQSSQNFDWKSTSLIFNVPQSTDGAFLVLRNNGVGGCGNDLAIDDITFSPYIPFTIGYDAITTDYCIDKTIRLEGKLNSGIIPTNIPYIFQWQVADMGTTNWSSIGGVITNFANAYIDLNVGDIGNTNYRLISAADIQNFNNTNCYVASASFDGNSVVIPTGSITTDKSDVCGTPDNKPADAIFTVNYQGNIFPWTYYYQVNGGDLQSKTVTGVNVKSDKQTIAITDNTTITLVKISTSGQLGCDVDINSNLFLTYSIQAPPAPVKIIGPNPACIGSTATFSVLPVQGAVSYNWLVNGGGWKIISGQGTNSVVLEIGNTPIRVSISTVNSCGSNSLTSDPFETTNLPPVAPSTIIASNGLCFPNANTSGMTDVLFEASAVQGVQNYNWEWDNPIVLSPSQISGSSGQFLRQIVLSVPNNVSTFKVRVSTQNGCGESQTKEVMFTPNRPPLFNAGADFTKSCSENQNGKSIGAGPETGLTYLWSPGDDLSSTSTSNPVANPWETKTYNVTVTNTNGCKTTDDITVTVDIDPIKMPSDEYQEVACVKEINIPTPPEVLDCFGDKLQPEKFDEPESTCNGKIVYSWKYTDKAGREYIWKHTVMVNPMPFAPIEKTFETSECFHYPVLPVIKDNCGNILKPSGPVETSMTNCEGCKTITYTYTDCAGNTQDYVHEICIRRTTLPVEVGNPVSKSSTVELVEGGVVPTPSVFPIVKDVCGNELSHGEPLTGGTYDGTAGTKTYTHTYIDCTGLKFMWTYTFNILPVIVVPTGETQLSYRFANPKIVNESSGDFFEFDVQVKANVSGTTFLKGIVNLDYNSTTMSSIENDWTATTISGYNAFLTISETELNVDLNNIGTGLFISTDYQTLLTIRGLISNNTGVAGIDFDESKMNGVQYYKVPDGEDNYYSVNAYAKNDLIDTYVGRVYSAVPGWTQVGGLDWNKSENTSVWDGDALITGGTDVSSASNLRVHVPATLAIPADGKVTVSGDTEINSTEGLKFESTGSGTGSLITGTASGAGSTVAERYMTTGAWHFIASPVADQSISNFLTSNLNIATDVDADVYAPNAIRGMMDYDPTYNVWNEYFTNSKSGNLETGKGFSIRTNASSAVDFVGNLNAGDLEASGLISNMWNCIGNPYTSAIGINSGSSSLPNFLNDNENNIDPNYGAIYVWDNLDANNGLADKYTAYSNAVPRFEVQQGQAFMVKVKNTSDKVEFNPAMQIHNTALSLKSAKRAWPTIILEAAVNNLKSSTTIAFNNGMTKGLDPTYDAGLFRGSSVLTIYTKLVEDNGIPFAIQALPEDALSNLIIPIGIESEAGGEAIFSSETMNLPTTCRVILEDKVNHTFTDLSKNVYRTVIEANSSISDRFQLHTSNLTTGINPGSLDGKLSAYGIRNVEIHVNGPVSSQAIATLYDIQGKVILVKNLEEGQFNVIQTPNIKTAIYLLFVKDKGKVQSFKIPMNE
jgi:hypothetical protein